MDDRDSIREVRKCVWFYFREWYFSNLSRFCKRFRLTLNLSSLFPQIIGNQIFITASVSVLVTDLSLLPKFLSITNSRTVAKFGPRFIPEAEVLLGSSLKHFLKPYCHFHKMSGRHKSKEYVFAEQKLIKLCTLSVRLPRGIAGATENWGLSSSRWQRAASAWTRSWWWPGPAWCRGSPWRCFATSWTTPGSTSQRLSKCRYADTMQGSGLLITASSSLWWSVSHVICA